MNMETKILDKIAEIEHKHNVEVLFAVESGSRAWGFASPDSDYDIRFVYKHKADWYLNLWEQRDSIQFMTEDDLDGSGWDLRKALRLLRKSNASFLGWLGSPIVYMDNTLTEFQDLAKECFNPLAVFYHYHGLNKNFRASLETNEVNLKDFFYALRSAFCANWVIKNRTAPPVLFTELYDLVEHKYHSMLDELIVVKSELKEQQHVVVKAKLLELAKNVILENESGKDNLKEGTRGANCNEQLNAFFLNQM